jgi:hypothetical protein
MADEQLELEQLPENEINFDNISACLTAVDKDFSFEGGSKIDINYYTGDMNTYCTANDLNSLAAFNLDTNKNFKNISINTIESLKKLSGNIQVKLDDCINKTDLDNYYTKNETDNTFWKIDAGQSWVNSRNFATIRMGTRLSCF